MHSMAHTADFAAPSALLDRNTDFPAELTEETVPSPGADPDVVLMLGVKNGDPRALQALFAKHSKAFINFAQRFIGNRARAEELVQDTFLQIFRARERYEPRARFTTFAYRVLTNLCLNEVRRFEYKNKLHSIDQPIAGSEESPRDFLLDESASPEDHLVGAETAQRIATALETLPATQRAALLLARVEGMPYAEAAECLGTTVSAIKSLIFRATESLRRELGDLIGNAEAEPA